ncbi:MAG: peptidylprolyl isomerase [Gemmatimonadaceae bacterium]
MRKVFLVSMIAALPVIGRAQVAAPPAARPAATPASIPVDRVVAVVGDQVILWSDVINSINQQRANGLELPKDSIGQATLAKDALSALVDEEILVQKAHLMKVDVTQDEVNRTVDDQVKRVRGQFKTDDEYKAELKTAGFGTPEEYKRTLYEQFYRRALQQRAFEELRKTAVGRNVSDAEVQEAFDKNKASLQAAPATVTFRQIVVPPKATPAAKKVALAKAEALLVEIKKGGDFELIAKRESMDPGSKPQGGDLGWNRRGTMVPEFDRVMFALSPGQLSPVIETPFGYHIIRVDRVQAAEVKARHILISPTIDSADVVQAKLIADTVAQLMRKGVSFDSLVAKYHDPAEEKGILQPFVRDSLPAAYQSVIAGKKGGDVAGPFTLSNPRGASKWAVIQLVNVNEAGVFDEAQVKSRIREQLVAEKATRSLLDQLRKRTYVALRL